MELPDNGMIHLSSPYGFAETIARLESVLLAKGFPVLARIRHSDDAIAAGLKMRPTELVIFGKAQAGTPPMVAAPTLAIDLPLKALIWEGEDAVIRISYNDPLYLKQRHNIPEELLPNLAGIGPLLEAVVR